MNGNFYFKISDIEMVRGAPVVRGRSRGRGRGRGRGGRPYRNRSLAPSRTPPRENPRDVDLESPVNGSISVSPGSDTLNRESHFEIFDQILSSMDTSRICSLGQILALAYTTLEFLQIFN